LTRFALIVAGGSGQRMGALQPKQFLLLAGKPLLMRTIEVFSNTGSSVNIFLVLPESNIGLWKDLCHEYNFILPHRIVIGGDNRGNSVKNGLDSINATDGLVAVHDGVRPLVDKNLINRAFTEAEMKGNAIPCVKVNDSLRLIRGSANIPLDREKVRAVQTPQCFRLDLLRQAYKRPDFDAYTDDAQLYEAQGFDLAFIDGSNENIKITTPADLLVAESILKSRFINCE
jgi:2-C-methyl-D-erythritol 4-phosphate cytidylyltransferase